jgi:hypothetical protein
MQNLSKKSLILLCDVQAEWSNPQVLFSPRKPKAKVGHLPIAQGMEKAMGMAPPRGVGVGWEPLLRLFLPHYGCSTSRGYATRTQNADYGGVAEAARFQPMRSVTSSIPLALSVIMFADSNSSATRSRLPRPMQLERAGDFRRTGLIYFAANWPVPSRRA